MTSDYGDTASVINPTDGADLIHVVPLKMGPAIDPSTYYIDRYPKYTGIGHDMLRGLQRTFGRQGHNFWYLTTHAD
jgi:hypothetical protein